jgi:tRNA 2-selenouridine synthase
VWVESESRTIGRLRVPEALMLRMRASPCVVVDMPPAARVQLLMQDYRHFVDDVEAFGDRLDALKELRGAATVARWREVARQGGLAEVVTELLEQHYDPVYLRSMSRNYAGFAAAPVCELPGGSEASMARAVLQLQSLPKPLPDA